ncbi:MAG: exopolysaccharide biosynthesis polyprenyl glycosylphosphotransferase [Lachnospiraceae bacterium]|nr:exopolysaccharide biosynthesis polyprenyl glycosylphosphotransferase [Lachnospiraceae bacterium]
MRGGKNIDQYKRTILFMASFIGVLLYSLCFAYVWYKIYAEQMFVVTFYRRGNYFIIGIYYLILFFFSNMYGGLKIGQLKRTEVVLSQMLSLFLTNVIAYMIISLLAFRFVNPLQLFIMMLVQVAISIFWEMVTTFIYNKIFQPWKMLLIYGEHPAADLVYKVDSRRDKYAIYEAVNIDEGIEVIAEKMKNYEAVIIGDISAIKRNDILKYCYANRIRAYVMPKLSDIILMGADRIHVFDTPFLLTKGYTLSFDERLVKRFVDILLSLLLIVIFSPVMLISAIIIKVQDGGPVFYKQVRCTQDEKEFDIIKFRSMIVNAESDGVAKLATKGDSRITKFGAFIRATRIDELPQLFNILKGEMSFVGPRPERPEIMKEYKETMPEFPFRNRVKAGLTGFAQVYGKYNTTPYDKLKLDLFYIENYSVWLDIKLIMMTVKIALKKEATEGIDEGSTTAEKGDLGVDVQDAVKEVVKKEENSEG